MEGLPQLNIWRKAAALVATGTLLAGCTRGSTSRAESNDPTHIVFASNRGGSDYDIYEKDLSTHEVVDLTPSAGDDMNPELSPDGKKVVFYSDRTGTNQIYELELEHPDNVQRLTQDNAQDYDSAYMPDGHIVYKSNKDDSSQGNGDIWLMNANGSDAHNLTSSMPDSEEWKPAPVDNKHIIFTSRSTAGKPDTDELFQEDLVTGEISQITHNSLPDWFPSVCAKTGLIAFVSKTAEASSDAIFTQYPTENGRGIFIGEQTALKIQDDVDDPSWSGDCKKLAFVNQANGHYGIYEADIDKNIISQLDIAPEGYNDLAPIFVKHSPAPPFNSQI